MLKRAARTGNCFTGPLSRYGSPCFATPTSISMCERESTPGHPCHGTVDPAHMSTPTSGSRHARAIRLRALGIDRSTLAKAPHEVDRFLVVEWLEDDVGPGTVPYGGRSEQIDGPPVVSPPIDENAEMHPVV